MGLLQQKSSLCYNLTLSKNLNSIYWNWIPGRYIIMFQVVTSDVWTQLKKCIVESHENYKAGFTLNCPMKFTVSLLSFNTEN